jgi:MoaA/NifB/PqqE/SkfB family radical SAM enzyme
MNAETVNSNTNNTNKNSNNKHPCFSISCAAACGRIHLPVAPKCSIQCNYCRRRFDCVNESRPGVSSKILSPREALERFLAAKMIMPNLSVVGIAGPGDALANAEETFETLRLIRDTDRDVLFCVSTNGLLLPEYAERLRDSGVTHITVTVNTLNAKTGGRIYRYIDYQGKRLMRDKGAEILLQNQIEGIKKAAGLGIRCKVNIVMLKGLNDGEIPLIVEKVWDLGVSISNIMQLIPVKRSLFQDMPLISAAQIDLLRKKCETILPQMYHCKQCRADAFGTLQKDMTHTFIECAVENKKTGTPKIETQNDRLKFAVSSRDGSVVDLHFGHTKVFFIYEYENGEVTLKEKRNVENYCSGTEACAENWNRLEAVIGAIGDCNGVITMRVGNAPERELYNKGVGVFITYDYAENAVREAVKKMKGTVYV